MGWFDFLKRPVKRAYESSSKGRRTDGWRYANADGNAEAKLAGAVTRQRSRDTVQNNPVGRSMQRVITDNIIGTGIVPKFQNARHTELWSQWGGTRECDSMGLLNFYGLQTKICKAVIASGGCLVRARARLISDGLAVPFQLEVLEDDHLDSNKTQSLPNGGWIIQGVEFSPVGRVAAFWVFRIHPGSQMAGGQISFRVDASECTYIFDATERPGVVRGVSWLAAALLKLRDIDEMDDAVIAQAKVAACFGVMITKNDDADDSAEIEDGVERVTPGMIERLNLGEEVNTLTPPTFMGYRDYNWLALHKACAAVGVPYELVFGDLMNVNFSSGRLGFTEFSRRVEVWQYQIFVPMLCERVGEWFVRYAGLMGVQGPAPVWTAPRRQMLDPGSDTDAVKNQVRSGLLTPFDALRQQGYSDPAGVMRAYADDWAAIDALGLVFDSDPRKVAAPGGAGLTQAGDKSKTAKKEDI